jgi:hypothetical protein
MTFGDYPFACMGQISTAVHPFTLDQSALDGYSTTWRKHMNKVSSALAIMSPNVVAWQESDLPLFPTAYASSLAQKIGVPFPDATTPAVPGSGSSTGLPRETNPAPEPPTPKRLTEGAKAVIGVCVSIGTVALVGFIFFVRLRWRRREYKGPGGGVATAIGDLPELITQEGSGKRLLGGGWGFKSSPAPRPHSPASLPQMVHIRPLPTNPIELETEREPLEIGATTPIEPRVQDQ